MQEMCCVQSASQSVHWSVSVSVRMSFSQCINSHDYDVKAEEQQECQKTLRQKLNIDVRNPNLFALRDNRREVRLAIF